MSWGPVTGCILLGFGLVFLLEPGIIFLAERAQLGRGREFHHTNKRSVPRFGGLGLALAFLTVELFLTLYLPEERANLPTRKVVVLSSLAMFALGFCDDLVALGAKRKLIGQILIAVWVYVSGIGIETFKIPFTERILE